MAGAPERFIIRRDITKGMIMCGGTTFSNEDVVRSLRELGPARIGIWLLVQAYGMYDGHKGLW